MVNKSSLSVSAFLSSILGVTVVCFGYEVSQFSLDNVEALPVRFLKSLLVFLPLTIAWTMLLAALGCCLMYWRGRVRDGASISFLAMVRVSIFSVGAGGAALGYWIGKGSIVILCVWFLGIFASLIFFLKLEFWRARN
jgi:hypothetical protein